MPPSGLTVRAPRPAPRARARVGDLSSRVRTIPVRPTEVWCAMTRDVSNRPAGPAGESPGEGVLAALGAADRHELFRVLVGEADDLITQVDAEGRLLYVNAASRRVYGIEPGEALGLSAFGFVHPDDVERTRRAFRTWLTHDGGDALRFENRQVGRDGRVTAMVWTVYPLPPGPDGPAGFASIARDVTHRRLAEQALAASETLHRAPLDGMLDPVVTIDHLGTVQTASRSVQPVFGYAPDELVGRNINMLMVEPYRGEHDGYLAHYAATGETGILNRTRRFPVQRSDGRIIDVELSVNRVDVPGRHEPLFIGSFRDVTERDRARRAETSILRALAALGESSALLAHEIKNPLTAVNLALRAVADQLGEDHREVLEDLVLRMRKLERQLRQSLSFAKPLNLAVSSCRADTLFHDVVRSLDPLLSRAGVEVGMQVDPETPAFVADPRHIEEVLSNLVLNAAEMMEHGGRVVLSAQPLDDGSVCLAVEDDGPGIPVSLRQTLFKPFVTSKAQSTGLGLPICRRIIEEHGGSLRAVDGCELGGACFRIVLPVAGPVDDGGGEAA